jgi:hypothetical protein
VSTSRNPANQALTLPVGDGRYASAKQPASNPDHPVK